MIFELLGSMVWMVIVVCVTATAIDYPGSRSELY